MKRIALVLLLIASTAGAATVIGWSINNAYGLKLLTAFEAQDDCFVQISFSVPVTNISMMMRV